MPNGHLAISADAANSELAEQMRARLDAHITHGGLTSVSITASAPTEPAPHVVITGAIDEDLRGWDDQAPPQSIAGALWVGANTNTRDTVFAWLALRLSMPAGPLSDLTDDNGHALRWSVAEAATVDLPTVRTVVTDEATIRSRLDERPQVKDLGKAVERLGGETAEAVLASAQRFRDALAAVDGLADLPPAPTASDFDASLSELLGHVARRGISRWRSTKARQAARDDLTASAREAAGARLRLVIDAWQEQAAREGAARSEDERRDKAAADVADAVQSLALPVTIDFTKSPRPWSTGPAPSRRYVLVNPADREWVAPVEVATLREHEAVEPGTVVCLVLQSGFSLPAVHA